MKNFETRIKNLENTISGRKGNDVVMLDTLGKPPTLSFDNKVIKLTMEEVKNLDNKSLNKLLIKKGCVKIDKIKMFIVIKKYRGKREQSKSERI